MRSLLAAALAVSWVAAQAAAQEAAQDAPQAGAEEAAHPAAQQDAVQDSAQDAAQGSAQDAAQDAAQAAARVAAQDEARWGPVADKVGLGTAICTQEAPIVCAAVLCREAALSLGLMGVEHEDPQARLDVGVEIDGEMFRAEMASSQIAGDVLYIAAPIAVRDPLWARLRAGRSVQFHEREGEEGRAFSLGGSAAELDRVARGCR